MKKNLPSLIMALLLLSVTSLKAQYCGGSGPNVCTPGGPYTQFGFYPSYDVLPCAQIGIPYNQKVDLQVAPYIYYQGNSYAINWVKIDTILNLPCGLCWASSDSANTFASNSTGCVQISGTTYDAPGQYKLHVIVDAQATVGGFPYTITNQNAEIFGIEYWLRVQDLSGACAMVDTFAVGNTATATGTITAPTISGNMSFCSGQSTTLSISSVNYYAYKWSNGAITSSINVNSSGTYTVTAYAACSSATASATVTENIISAGITPSGPLSFCQGGSVTLTAASGNDTYTWSDNTTAQSITVNQSGTYTVTVTHGACTATDSKTITVDTISLSPVITPSVANICSGGMATLDAGSGYDTYTWSESSTNSSIQTSTGGTYTVTVTQGTCSGSASAIVNVGNFPVAVSISPADSVTACDGDAVSLDAGAGYDGYSWSSGENSQTIQPTASGNYIVTIMDNGCVGHDTVVVTFNSLPSPAITPAGPINICGGQTALLDAGSGFDSYLWSNNSTTQSIVVSNPGGYSVTVEKNGCTGSSTNGVMVNLHPSPVAHITVQVDTFGDGLMIVGDEVGSTLAWQFAVNYDTTGQLTTLTNTSDTLIINCDANAGYYRVIKSNTWGCSDTSSFAYIAPCVGIQPIKALQSFRLMPNPTSDLLSLFYTINNSIYMELNVTDMTGRVVQNLWQGMSEKGEHHQQVSVASLSAGMYFIHFKSAEATATYRFTKN